MSARPLTDWELLLRIEQKVIAMALTLEQLSDASLRLSERLSFLDSRVARLAQIDAEGLKDIGDGLQAVLLVENQILALLTPLPIAGIVLTISQGESTMKRIFTAGVDIQIPDDGSGNATAAISFVDDVGNPAVLPAGASVATTATLSDPAITAVVDATGLNIVLAPATPAAGVPPALVAGVSLSVSVTVTLASGTVLGPFTATGSTLLDVVAGGPAGVQIQEN